MAERYATFDVNEEDGTIRVGMESPDHQFRSDISVRFGEDFLGISYTDMLLQRSGTIAYEDEGQPRARIRVPESAGE